MNAREVFEGYVDVVTAERIAEWGFGDSGKQFKSALQFRQVWNNRNRDILELQPEGVIGEDVQAIIQEYLRRYHG